MVAKRALSISIRLPFRTILAVLATLAVVRLFSALAPLLMPLLLGSILAVSLAPAQARLERAGLPRWAGIFLIASLIFLGVLLLFALVLPRVFQESTTFFEHLPEFKADILSLLPEESQLRTLVTRFLSHQGETLRSPDIASLLTAGHVALGGIGELGLILVFAVYLLSDGPRIVAWLCAFFAPTTQKKIEATAEGVSDVVFAYVLGQVITSALSFIFVLIVLSLLKVPAALLLAMISGICDVLPVLGFFLAVVPAMLFALRVSPATAVVVFAAYLFYHGLENYVITPAVYGNRLRVSSFVVLLSLIGAGLAAGIEGAIAVLPIVASYPIIERIWLKPVVGERTVREHEQIEA